MATAQYAFGSLVTFLMLALWAELGKTPGRARHLQNQLCRLEGLSWQLADRPAECRAAV